jgi:hypothetical protein
MAISLVQSKWAITAGTQATISITLNGVASTSNLLVNAVSAWATNGAFTWDAVDVSDTPVHSYTLDLAVNPGGVTNCGAFWSVQNSTAGNNTIMTTPDLSCIMHGCVYEISGAETSNAYDTGNSGTGSSTNPATGNFTTAGAGIIIGKGGEDNSNTCTHTAGIDYSISESGAAHFDNGSSNYTGCAEHWITTGAQTDHSTTVTLGLSSTWLLIGAAYKQAAAGGGGSKVPLIMAQMNQFGGGAR